MATIKVSCCSCCCCFALLLNLPFFLIHNTPYLRSPNPMAWASPSNFSSSMSLMDVHRSSVWRTAGTLVYIQFAIRGFLFAIRGFCFFHVCRGHYSPQYSAYQQMHANIHALPFYYATIVCIARTYWVLYCTLQLNIYLRSHQKCSFFDDGENTTINLYSMDLHEDNPVSAETSNVCAQNGCMHTAWYISLHTVCIQSHPGRTCVHTVVLFFPGMQGILVPIVDCFTSKCTRISMRFWMTDWFILCTACIVRTVLVLYSSKQLIFSNQSGIILLFDDHGETLQPTKTAWILTRTTPTRLKPSSSPLIRWLRIRTMNCCCNGFVPHSIEAIHCHPSSVANIVCKFSSYPLMRWL